MTRGTAIRTAVYCPAFNGRPWVGCASYSSNATARGRCGWCRTPRNGWVATNDLEPLDPQPYHLPIASYACAARVGSDVSEYPLVSAKSPGGGIPRAGRALTPSFIPSL